MLGFELGREAFCNLVELLLTVFERLLDQQAEIGVSRWLKGAGFGSEADYLGDLVLGVSLVEDVSRQALAQRVDIVRDVLVAQVLVPADLQINLIGMGFTIATAPAALMCLVLLVLLLRRVSWAVHVACAFAPLLIAWSCVALFGLREQFDFLGALPLCSSALVIGSALAHGFRKDFEGCRLSPTAQALAMVGIVELLALVFVGVAAVKAH